MSGAMMRIIHFHSEHVAVSGRPSLVAHGRIEVQLLAGDTLGDADMVLGVLDILVELGSVVVKGILGNIVPLGLGLGSAHDELVVVHSLGDGHAGSDGINLGVTAEAGDGIVDGVAKRSLLVRVLGAAGRRANGVGLFIELKVLNDPLVLVHTFGEAEVTSGVLHILIKLRGVVIEGILGNVVPFGLRLRSAHDELVLMHGLGDGDAVSIGINLGVTAETRNRVIDRIAERGRLMLELSAASRGADGVRGRVKLNKVRALGVTLSIVEVAQRSLNVNIEGSGLISDHIVFGGSLPGPSAVLALGGLNASLGGLNIVLVSTEVGNRVVNRIAERGRLMLELSAASRGADRVGLDIDLRGNLNILNVPLAKLFLSRSEVLLSDDDVSVLTKARDSISRGRSRLVKSGRVLDVERLLSILDVPLSRNDIVINTEVRNRIGSDAGRRGERRSERMAKLPFGISDVSLSSNNIIVSTKVGDCVVRRRGTG